MAATSAGNSVFRSILRSNPFYLISACCMLAGCLALTNSLSWLSIPIPRLLALIAALNAYEAALIGLAAYLVLRRGLRRDGMILLIIEAFFLIDITFLNAEIATQKSWIGIAIPAFSLLAAIVKLGAVMRILDIRRSPAQFAFVVIQAATIFALPIAFSRMNGGIASPLGFYIAWWVVGLMPAVYEFLVKCLPDSQTQRSSMMTAYLVLPWLSLAAHLGILHYVYDIPFYGAMAAPVLLAIAMLFNRLPESRLVPRKDILALRILLPLAAILVSATSPYALTMLYDHAGHLTVTTLRLATSMAYLEIIYSFLRPYWLYSILAGIGCLLVVSFGPSPNQVSNVAQKSWNWSWQMLYDLVPNTPEGWGAVLVAAAFLFLGLGAAVSLRKSVSPTNI